MQIRRITAADRKDFLRLAKEFYHSEAVLHPIPAKYHQRAFEEMIRSDVYADGFMIEWNGATVGYGMTAKTFSHEAGGLTVWIEELYLVPEYRGRGIGHAFFAFIEEYYGDALCRLRLETEPGNTRAEALYKSIGYEELGYRPFVKEMV